MPFTKCAIYQKDIGEKLRDVELWGLREAEPSLVLNAENWQILPFAIVFFNIL